MDNFAAMVPFTYEPRLQKIVGVNQKIGGMNPVIDVRSWGYLTGGGHGALGINQKDAATEQDAFGELVARLLNQHFAANRAALDEIQRLGEDIEAAQKEGE